MSTSTSTLYVDLDGTLHRGDLTDEGLCRLLKKRPLLLLAALWWWITGGRSWCKRRLSDFVTVGASELVWIPEVLAFVKAERSRGRRLVLISGSEERWVKPIGESLSCFDEILGSDGITNLIGAAKVRAIEAREGGRPWGYVGNSKTDFAVWRHATEVIAVADRPSFQAAVTKQFPTAKVIRIDGQPRAVLLFRALRSYQWVKNLLVFLPLLLAHRIGYLEDLGQAVLAFVSFSAAASSVYLINDLMDLEHDRVHPKKSRRPFASGYLLPRYAFGAVPFLIGAALIAAAVLPPFFQLLLVGYLILSSLYSSVVKRIAILDVFLLAGLYVLRVFAGGAATDVLVSGWLLMFSMFFFLNLAVLKRYTEVSTMASGGTGDIFGRGYRSGDGEFLMMFGFGAGLLAVLVLALYVTSPDVTQLYRNPEMLWCVAPMVLAWLARTWLSALRGEVHHDPVVFAAQDRFTWLTAGAMVVVLLAAQLAP